MKTPELSVWAKGIRASPTLAVDAKAKALKAAGEDVCGFGAGEPDFDTPDFIKEACIDAIRRGETKYAPSSGIQPLREALAEKYKTFNGIPGVKPAQVIVSPGGKFSCHLGIMAVTSPGDEVIIPAPYWVSYPEMVKLCGGKPVFIQAGDTTGFKILPAQLEAAITPRTRLLILNSPSNPTGAVYTRAELEALVAVAMRHGLWILSDEIYEHLTYEGMKPCSPAAFSPEVAARTITVGGFSKPYSMTGWRLGTLMAPPVVADAVTNLQSQMTSNATTFAQYGALAALQQAGKAREALEAMCKVFDRRRILMHQGLSSIPGLSCYRSQGAFYLFPNISATGLKSGEFCERLLSEEKVALVPGNAFGADDYVRLSYATADATIAKGLERLASFCKRLVG